MDKLTTSKESEIKADLERELKYPLTSTQWDFIKAQGVLEIYDTSPLEKEGERWAEFVRGAEAALKQLQMFYERRREEEDEGYSRPDISLSRDREQPTGPLVEPRGSERTVARTEALLAYNRLQAGTDAVPNRPAMYATLFPRGGTDHTVAQWVYVLQVELWVPAEEVKAEYLELQQTLTEEKARKADPRSLEVARFVWEQRRRAGEEKLSYPDLTKGWNESRPDDQKYSNWRSFRTAFTRGKEATLPRYKGSIDLLHEEVNKGYGKDLFGSWASDVRATF